MIAKSKKLDLQTLKQQELLYTQEFNLQHLERKVTWGCGWTEVCSVSPLISKL